MSWRNYDTVLSRFDRIPECDGRADGRTNRIAIVPINISLLTRDKNAHQTLQYTLSACTLRDKCVHVYITAIFEYKMCNCKLFCWLLRVWCQRWRSCLGCVLGSNGWSGYWHYAVCVGKRLSSSRVWWRNARQATISHQRRSLSTLRHLTVRCGRHSHRRRQLTY